MTIADEARDNAVPCEMVLYAYRKNKDGVVVSFVVHPEDMPDQLATARIGSRWVGALVQVGDDELPVHQPAKETNSVSARVSHARPQPVTDKLPVAAKRDWKALPKPQQAGIRISEATFAAYLREEHPRDWREAGDPDGCIKFMCGISSKRELATDKRAGAIWFQIDSGYLTWLAKDRVGA